MSDPAARQRVDKWLWFARFFKTRGLAGEVAASGKLRINGRHCAKPAQAVGPGDELSFVQGGRVRAIRVEAIGARRGPASEAQTLYTDLDPAPPPGAQTAPAPEPRAGERPTKKDRREIDALRRLDP
ncbi:MAG: RNA-binding S4 domain-containing protein [Pseudomonadota bacterium]